MERSWGAGPGPYPEPDPLRAYDAAAALGDTAAARRRTAERMITPRWYHPALGLATAAFALVLAQGSGPGALVGAAVFLGIGFALKHVYQRMTGLWIGPEQLGPCSSRWFRGYTALVATVLLLAVFAEDLGAPGWTVPAGAAALLVGTVVLGRTMDDRLRAEIRSGAAPRPPKGAR